MEPVDQDALVSENQRLRRENRWWKIVTLGALFLVFLALIPFTAGLNEARDFLRSREILRANEELSAEIEKLKEANEKSQELNSRVIEALHNRQEDLEDLEKRLKELRR